MSGQSQSTTYYIGWDVGGWNCDRNSKSRDAIVILDAQLKRLEQPYWGNLRQQINEAETTEQWIDALFQCCGAERPTTPHRITLAIDTPLGFSASFAALITELSGAVEIGKSEANPYLFRQTENFLFDHGLKPLSAVKDMIGSQATKGMHVLSKFARERQSCGIWSDGAGLTVIETYPSACKISNTIKSLWAVHEKLANDDMNDALTCALVAHLHCARQEALASPDESVPAAEGWIWVPKDVLKNKKIRE